MDVWMCVADSASLAVEAPIKEGFAALLLWASSCPQTRKELGWGGGERP